MQRKAYVPGVAALLVALLAAGCTSGSDTGGTDDNSNPGDAGTASAVAEPGRYRTLPEPCGAVSQETLDTLLPGIQQLTDEAQQEKAYEGTPTTTFDTDRKVGCQWKVESADATDHLLVDLERVVSYDNSVSDDSQAQALFAEAQTAAHLPEPSESATSDVSSSATPSDAASASATPSSSSSASPSDGSTPADLQPRVLDDLGDEAFLNDVVSSSGSTARQRTVTVAFRTSNVIVTVEYEEQPTTVGTAPDSKEMQDRARNLAAELAEALAG
ncbi:DUF3558 domain-containing protein [Streptomyces justiciae]|uniref:DUF3558 domain-containing protein n=1 Tax=Streptomyces justiciae TaxID=2780140 RepID=A0ABU3LZ95_9ACTN|nr:DUF3558 domain-containing protein [Streptomyces justiciae]MBE8476928.1 DUF3558 domain-containing protein [Streptomyces justiciae]MCW8379658.1 DUF3558 domain-containing protein [Streptomyces justiciae]MDT7843843.1 DUF3558 domain-containing protein [Streptomyces justiciae]